MEFVMASLDRRLGSSMQQRSSRRSSLPRPGIREMRGWRRFCLSGVRSSLYLFPSSADAALFKTPLVTDQSPNMPAKLLDF